VVQHRHRNAGEVMLASLLSAVCHAPVVEIGDKQPIERGRVYVAPADYHVIVEREHFELTVDEPVAFSRPSVDVVFETAADAFGAGVVAVVLTGANADGAAGLMAVRRVGGITVAQDPATAERREMPEAAVATGCVMHVLELDRIGPFLGAACATAADR
jgi:two-component system chemotaxis response regulator CheB